MMDGIGERQRSDPATLARERQEPTSKNVHREEEVTQLVYPLVISPSWVEPQSSTEPAVGARVSSTVPTARHTLWQCVVKDRAVIAELPLSDLLGTVREFP